MTGCVIERTRMTGSGDIHKFINVLVHASICYFVFIAVSSKEGPGVTCATALLAYTKYVCRRRLNLSSRPLALLDTSTWAFNTFSAKHLKKPIPQCQACFMDS